MDIVAFRKHAHQFVDWMANYLENVEEYPVKSEMTPGDLLHNLPQHPPTQGEGMEAIFADFQQMILPGVTHWQSPNFFAYFPANSSPPSILAEMLTATLGAQCMVWETSPAAAELEERMMEWLRDLTGLPDTFTGVIQDTASTATLCALLTAREVASDFQINQKGFQDFTKLRVYCSEETHSSIEKGVKIAGIGKENLVKIPVDNNLAMKPDLLQEAIKKDRESGYQPMCVVAALGTTGTTAFDPLEAIGKICQEEKIWLHVDAAYAGAAFVLPELRHWLKGIEYVDSYVFNPHKWLLTNFDCTAYYVKDPNALVNTFAILPEYLKTSTHGKVNDYRDWGIALGRRFRALKLWFVLRSYGAEGLKSYISNHLEMAQWFEKQVVDHPDFELLAPTPLNLVCFRYRPKGTAEGERLDRLNRNLLDRLNNSGRLYLTHTRIQGNYTLRMVCGSVQTTMKHVQQAWKQIVEMA